MYSCFDISKEFLALAKEEGLTIAPMKLLKLVYIAHGYHLGFKKKPLINNPIQAWKYGPVIPELYHTTKKFGRYPVDPDLIEMFFTKELTEEDKHFLKLVWNAYKHLNGLQLSTLTHAKDTPWEKTYDGVHNKLIPNNLIEEYYTNMINQRSNAAN